MFTDIVGYTALMGRDESNALAVLQKNRALQKSAIDRHGGHWIKELGDGVLSSFNSVSDAVAAALEIQRACQAENHYELRIGIHLGEVIFQNDDVFGDGVNIASRVQSAARPGTIFISRPVYRNLANKVNINIRYVDVLALKNVPEPIRIYEVLTGNDVWSPKGNGTETTTEQKSIAVLPFVNMSNDPEQEYFSDGMSEEILNSLTHLKELKVAGRTSSFQFKGKSLDLREVGQKLGVRNVLEGSVRKHGKRLRITAQLINVDDGFHLWSERYDRDLDDIFAIQDEIALAITEKLKLTLLQQDKERIVAPHTLNTTAHGFYLKGRHEWSKRTREGFLKSIDYFDQAIREDPKYSLAYTGKADSYSLLCAYHILSPQEAIPYAQEAAEKAMALDPGLADAYEAVGHMALLEGTRWKAAEENYCKAIELNPGFATARQRHALILAHCGRHEDALKQIEKAHELDPLSLIINTDVALIHLLAGRVNEALSKCGEVLALNVDFPVAHFIRGLAYEAKGDWTAAIACYRHGARVSNDNPIALSALGHSSAGSGDEATARRILGQLEQAKGTFVSPYCLAVLHAGLGEKEKAMALLERAAKENSGWMIHLHFGCDPRFNAYRDDPRFTALS